MPSNNRGFTPSGYSADKTATTTVAGQSEALARGAGELHVPQPGRY